MNILEFGTLYTENESCITHFRNEREKVGIVCKRCSCKDHYWLTSKNQWQCKSCRFRTTIKSGTIMEDSKFSLLDWYKAICLITFSKKGISAKELQRQFDRKWYKSTWLLFHKIRKAMGNRDSIYQLKGSIELDDAYITVETTEKEKKKQKAGRGTVTHSSITVMAESTKLENIETGKRSSHCGYYKMKVTESQKSTEVNEIVEKLVDSQTIVFTDKSTSYVDIEKYVEAHYTELSSNETTKTTLKWVHVAISNAKRTFNGIYHKINAKYLQNYLDEFCYKLNRRYFGKRLFDRLVVAVAQNLVAN